MILDKNTRIEKIKELVKGQYEMERMRQIQFLGLILSKHKFRDI